MIWGVQQRLGGIPSNLGGDLKGLFPQKSFIWGVYIQLCFVPPKLGGKTFLVSPSILRNYKVWGGTSKSLEKVWGVQKSVGGIL